MPSPAVILRQLLEGCQGFGQFPYDFDRVAEFWISHREKVSAARAILDHT